MKKELNELEMVYLMFSSKKMLNLTAEFGGYADGIFSYYITDKKGYTYELTFIADDTLLKEMEIGDILTLNRIQYFLCRVFDFGEKLIHSYEPYNTIKHPEITIKPKND